MGNLFQGYQVGGQDWNTFSFDSSADFTPSGTGNMVLNYGINVLNFSGATVSGVGTVLATLPSGVEGTTSSIYVLDGFGGAAGCNIVVSGTASGQTINGALTTTINTKYGRVHLYNYSGTNWVLI